ncbi:GreA/GreB family elongation factor [Caldimonas brevitalea]|uniref:Regulator of nucleoside diphosphate kinase n=1 Tax=Caldimonas brevitalea TaxID=413882 RepID=A0A0G3BKU2_9BURK|nr:GreA/GreB family elongation factor [Caldimonas brevitalea]AKJ30074.1 regulator of nucleoside diphosphate kinase [Caldimonas brevitalea]
MSAKPNELVMHKFMSSSQTERILTELDAVRIRRLLRRLQPPAGICETVELLLDTATVVPSARVPADVVTLHAQARLSSGAGLPRHVVTLCHPAAVDAAHGFISVFSPLGLALLGLREGDVVEWATPHGSFLSSRLEEVLFQPEANGELTR